MNAIAPEASCAARRQLARGLGGLVLGLSLALPQAASAQQFPGIAGLPGIPQTSQAVEDPQLVGKPQLLYAPTATTPRLYGVSYRLAPGWKASYGLGLGEETALSSTFLRLPGSSAGETLSARGSRENWRHFLGVEFQPLQGFSLLGGFAKSSGTNSRKDIAPAPTGYERLRLNSGARWRGRNWGLDGTFSFIHNGPRRLPDDASFFPGQGGTGPTWLLAISVSRRF